MKKLFLLFLAIASSFCSAQTREDTFHLFDHLKKVTYSDISNDSIMNDKHKSIYLSVAYSSDSLIEIIYFQITGGDYIYGEDGQFYLYKGKERWLRFYSPDEDRAGWMGFSHILTFQKLDHHSYVIIDEGGETFFHSCFYHLAVKDSVLELQPMRTMNRSRDGMDTTICFSARSEVVATLNNIHDTTTRYMNYNPKTKNVLYRYTYEDCYGGFITMEGEFHYMNKQFILEEEHKVIPQPVIKY